MYPHLDRENDDARYAYKRGTTLLEAMQIMIRKGEDPDNEETTEEMRQILGQSTCEEDSSDEDAPEAYEDSYDGAEGTRSPDIPPPARSARSTISTRSAGPAAPLLAPQSPASRRPSTPASASPPPYTIAPSSTGTSPSQARPRARHVSFGGVHVEGTVHAVNGTNERAPAPTDEQEATPDVHARPPAARSDARSAARVTSDQTATAHSREAATLGTRTISRNEGTNSKPTDT